MPAWVWHFSSSSSCNVCLFHRNTLITVFMICMCPLCLQTSVQIFWTLPRLWSRLAAFSTSLWVKHLTLAVVSFSPNIPPTTAFLLSARFFRPSLNWLRNRDCGKGKLPRQASLYCLQLPLSGPLRVKFQLEVLEDEAVFLGLSAKKPASTLKKERCNRGTLSHTVPKLCGEAGKVTRISCPSAFPPPSLSVPEGLRCVSCVCLPLRTLILIQNRLREEHALQEVLYKTLLKGGPTALPPRSAPQISVWHRQKDRSVPLIT